MTVDYQPGTHKERNQRPKTPNPGLSKPNQQLVVRLAQTLQTLEEAANPTRSTEIGGQSRTKTDGSEADEGAATRWARTLENRIHRQLRPLLNEFDARLAGSYEAPPKREKVRCVRKKCSAYGKRLPRFVGPRLEIELLACQVCGNRLTAA